MLDRVADMPAAKGRPILAIRVDPETLDQLDELAESLTVPMRAVTRTDVARHALLRGLALLQKEHRGKRGK